MDAPEEFLFSISRKAPRFLDADGRRIDPDPLAEAWKQLQQGFAQLHGQRLLELMHWVLHEMPEEESMRLEWEQDESFEFYLRFSNGWSLGSWTEDPDQPTPRFENKSDAAAPAWFPRDEAGLQRWMHWLKLLSTSTIGQGVDHIAQDRLEKLSEAKDGLRRSDLGDIARALVGEEWQAALDRMALAETTPAARQVKPKSRL